MDLHNYCSNIHKRKENRLSHPRRNHFVVQSHIHRRNPVVSFVFVLLTLLSHSHDQDRMNCGELPALKTYSIFAFKSSPVFITGAYASPQPNQQESFEYELETPLNYYQLLDLESPTTHRRPKSQALNHRKKRSNFRSKITNDQIKKAYRKQAQLYHPDKLAARRKRLQEATNSTNDYSSDGSKNPKENLKNDPLANMTIEEATSRFAQIAEAYQVLSDPVQRYEYDWELLDMEDELEEERLFMEEEKREKDKFQQQHIPYERQQQSFNNNVEWSLYDKIKNGASNFHAWKNSLNLDPWAVFDEFFFEESTTGSEGGRWNNVASPEEYGFADGFYDGSHVTEMNSNFRDRDPKQRNHSFPRVSETTVYRGYDLHFNAKSYTVLRREEYINEPNSNGEFFYRILGQDFIGGTQIDPLTGLTLREYYTAVTEPYLVEDGYTQQHNLIFSEKDYEYNSGNERVPKQSTFPNQSTRRKSPHTLEEGESFTPASAEGSSEETIWISPNKKFQAYLSPTCELQILRRDDRQQNGKFSSFGQPSADAIVWSSETYVPNNRAGGCHLTLSPTGRLTLSVDYGSSLGEKHNTVLWITPMPPIVPHLFHEGEEQIQFQYYASLDDDGVMAVYRLKKTNSNDYAHGSYNARDGSEDIGFVPSAQPGGTAKSRQTPSIFDKLGSLYRTLSKTSAMRGQTKAALAWNHVRYNFGKFLVGRPLVAGFTSLWNISGSKKSTRSESATKKQENRQPIRRSKEEFTNPAEEDVFDPKTRHRHECVYATSPAGCLAPGRNAIYLTKSFARSFKRSFQSIDSKLDQFIDHFMERVDDLEDGNSFSQSFNYGLADLDDEDGDILDTLIRITGSAGRKVGAAAHVGLMRGKRLAEDVANKIKETADEHSIQWGE